MRVTSWDSLVSDSPALGIQSWALNQAFYVHVGDPDSGPHARMASAYWLSPLTPFDQGGKEEDCCFRVKAVKSR